MGALPQKANTPHEGKLLCPAPEGVDGAEQREHKEKQVGKAEHGGQRGGNCRKSAAHGEIQYTGEDARGKIIGHFHDKQRQPLIHMKARIRRTAGDQCRDKQQRAAIGQDGNTASAFDIAAGKFRGVVVAEGVICQAAAGGTAPRTGGKHLATILTGHKDIPFSSDLFLL